jgi:hypothetical protein
LYSISSGDTVVLKAHNVATLYNWKQRKYKKSVGALRKESVAALKGGEGGLDCVSRKNSLTVVLHRGQVNVVITCRLTASVV